MTGPKKQRDKEITREIHRLFWEANLEDKFGLVVCYVGRTIANLAYNVFIPLVIAYGVQAIITKQFDDVPKYALAVVALAIIYCIGWSIGGIFIIRNAKKGTEYLLKKVFQNYLSKDYEFYNNTYFGSLAAQFQRLRDSYNEYCQVYMLTIPKQVVL